MRNVKYLRIFRAVIMEVYFTAEGTRMLIVSVMDVLFYVFSYRLCSKEKEILVLKLVFIAGN